MLGRADAPVANQKDTNTMSAKKAPAKKTAPAPAAKAKDLKPKKDAKGGVIRVDRLRTE